MLNVKSCYSISKSTIKIDEYVQMCSEHGLQYATICDNDFYALPEFLRNCEKNDLKAIFGLSDDKDFNFFILNRKGYELLIRYKNKVVDLDILLKSEDIFTIYSGEASKYPEMKDFCSNLLFASDLNDTNNGMSDAVFFREINSLYDADEEALKLIQQIGKVKDDEKKAHLSLESYLNLREQNLKDTLFKNMERLIDKVEAYNLKVDYKIPILNPNDKTDDKILLQKAEASFFKRFKENNMDLEVYKNRFDYEYGIISKKGFSRYLLLADEIVRTAREIGAVVGPGRGSAVSSLLVYLLDITRADPVKHKLIFERFLSEDREDEPDIDIDVEDQMRPELLKMLNKKYGKYHMVHVITFGTYGEKLVKRELSKHLGINTDQMGSGTYDHLINSVLGLPHHISTHAAGIIFSEEDLRHMIPLQELNDNFHMTQFDMDSLKACGLFKMDILGLITLSVLKEMNPAGNKAGEFPFYDVNPEDKKVIESLKKDNLKGIFQLDSKSGRHLADRFTPETFDEIRVMISLNRPGPNQSGLTDEWINRRNGEKKVEYYHPLVKEILSDTYGVPIFQEQIMEMSMKLGGFSPRQANDLRKAMAKKDPEKMKRHEISFVGGCVARDMEEDAAKELFNMMYEFAGYAFNKAHATAYSFITFWTAYAKYYFPLYYYKTMIDSNHGKYEKLFDIINEARKNGVKVFPPDINKSDYLTIVEDDGLRLGFHIVKEFSRNTAENIITEREHGLFKSAEDFVYRLDEKSVSDKILQKCIWAHLFWSLDKQANYKELVFLRNKNKKALKKIGARLFGEISENENNSGNILSDRKLSSLDSVKDELFSYGFVVNYLSLFSLQFYPFMNGDMGLGMVLSEEKNNLYKITAGGDSQILSTRFKLKPGQFILFQRKKGKIIFAGFYFPDSSTIEVNGSYYSNIEKDISKDAEHIRNSGIKRLNIKTAKRTMEVLL